MLVLVFHHGLQTGVDALTHMSITKDVELDGDVRRTCHRDEKGRNVEWDDQRPGEWLGEFYNMEPTWPVCKHGLQGHPMFVS